VRPSFNVNVNSCILIYGLRLHVFFMNIHYAEILVKRLLLIEGATLYN